ncbi:MAG: autotransporter domain-containing protein, partial [Verrucomicrobiales bacterium]|nr:autotransporter domain-containing protein [Verrucomicrobiales bacterium]
GTLILSALNHYSGTTTVNSGTLTVSGTITGNTAGKIADGVVNVSGLWDVARLDIGGSSGRLAITGQGRVQSVDTVIAEATADQGSLAVSGNGMWSGGTLTVGGAGAGALTLSERGTVSADELLLARDAGASGTLTVNSDAVRLTSTAAGRLTISGGAGDSTVVFDHHGDFVFDSAVTGSVSLTLASGTTTFTATSSDHRGTVSVSAGAMLRAGAANVISPNAAVVINSGGFYQLNNFSQNLSRLTNSGGTVDFGGTDGSLTVGTLSGNGVWLFHANTETGARSSITVSNGSSGTERVTLQLTGNGTVDPAQVLNGMINDPYQAVWKFDDFNWGLFDYSAGYQNGTLTVRRNGASTVGAVISSVPEIQRRAWFAQQDSLRKRMGDVRLSLTPAEEDTAADDDEWRRRIDQMFADMGIKMRSGQNAMASPSAPEQRLSKSFIENIWLRAHGSQLNIGRKVSGMAYDQIVYGSDAGTDHAWRLDARNTLLTGVYAGFGGSQADFKTGGVKAELTGYHGGLYASWWNTAGWYVDATLKGAMIDNKTSAPVAGSMARASFSNMEIGGSVEVGKRFNFGGGWFIEPQAQLNYMHLLAKDFQHGSLNIGTRDLDAVEFRVGVVGGRTVKLSGAQLLQTYLKLSGVGEASSGGHISNGVQTLRASSDGAKVEVGGGLIFQIDEHSQLHLDYEAEFGEKYTQPWGLTGGYRYQF